MGLLRWLGFVRLADYGLELTAERRIRASSWVVLDDGSGNAIVGWTAEDGGVQQLRKWQLVKPQAPVKEKDDEEWEWMIATARARAEGPRPAPSAQPAAPLAPPPPAAPPPTASAAPPHASSDELLDDQPTQAPIPDDLPTSTWGEDGNTELDPPHQSNALDRPAAAIAAHLIGPAPAGRPVRLARGTPSPEGAQATRTLREDPWRHEPTVRAQIVLPRSKR